MTRGDPIADFVRPEGVVQAKVDAFTGLLPGAFSTEIVTENFIAGTVPTKVDDTKVPLDVDASSGMLWAEGCQGPMEVRGFLDFSTVEANAPESWRKANADWIARAIEGVGTAGGPGKTKGIVSYF